MSVKIWLVMIYLQKTLNEFMVWQKMQYDWNPLWSVVQSIKGRTYPGPTLKMCVVESLETPMKSRKERSIWVSRTHSRFRGEIMGWVRLHSIWISSAEPHSAGMHCSFGSSSGDVSVTGCWKHRRQYIIQLLRFCLYLYTKWSRE